MSAILLENGTDRLLLEDGTSLLLLEGTFFSDVRQAILDGLDSAQAEATGWDALRSSIPVTAVVRTSATVVTITLPALPTYDITAQEVITATVPGSALVLANPLVATPTMTVNPILPPPYVDRPRGSIRPFPFLPGGPESRRRP